MAGQMPWEMDWSGSNGAPQPQTAQQPEQPTQPQPQAQASVEPWEMDWGQGNQAQAGANEDRSWGIYNSDDGSVLKTAGAGIGRQFNNVIASLTDDPETSRYQLRRAKQASAEYQQESDKLGVAGNVAAGFLTYAPAVAAGVVNPLLGAGVMGASTTADALAAQQENGQDYDWGTAGAAGAGSAAVDLATMGVAGRATNIARTLSTPARRTAAELAAQGGQASVSNTASQAFTNLASGRPWDENLGEAATIGAVTGAGIHAGLGGFNRTLGLKSTPESDASVNDVRDMSVEAGFQPHADFTSGVHDYTTTASNIRHDMNNSNLADSRQHIDALVNIGTNSPESNLVALKDAAKAAKTFGMPVTSNFFNFDVNGQNAATGLLGLSAKQITKDGQNIQHATPSLFNRSKAQGEGVTRESWRRDFKKGYDDAVNTFQGNSNANTLHIGTMLDSGSDSTVGMRPQLRDLRDALGQYQKIVTDVTESGNMPSPDVVAHYSRRIYELGNETGTLGQLKNPLTGKTGDFDPVANLKAMKMFHDGSVSNYPQVRHGIPNVDAEKGGYGIGLTDAAGYAITGTPIVTAGRILGKAYSAGASQRALRGTKARGSDIVDGLAREPAGFGNRAAQQGDFAAGAHEAAADLNSMGINTGGAEHSVPPSDNISPDLDVWGQPRVTPDDVATGATPEQTVSPEVAPEAPVEAPAPVRDPGNPDVWTGRRVRDREAEVAAQRAAEEQAAQQPAPEIDPEVAAAQRAAADQTLANDARVDASRRQAPPEEVVNEPVPETAPVDEVPAQRGNSDAELNVDAARRARQQREAQEAEPVVEEAPSEAPRGNRDSTLTQDAARMEANRNRAPESEPEASPEATRATEEPQPTERTTEEPEAAPEPLSEADAPEEISKPNKPKTRSSDLVKKPVDDLMKRVDNMSTKDRNQNAGLISQAYAQRDVLNKVRSAVDDAAADGRNHPEDIWDMVNRQGGLGAFGDGTRVKERLNSIIRKDKDESAAQAEADAKAANEIVDESINSNVGEDMGEVLDKMRKNFISKNVPESVFDEAKQRASDLFNGQYSPEHVANQVREIMKARAAETRRVANDAKKNASKAPKVEGSKPIERTMQDSHDDVTGYARALGVADESEIKDLIKSETNSGNKDRSTFRPLSEGKEKTIYNKIDKFVKDQMDAYDRALSSPNTNQPAELANWRKKVANLKQRREDVKSSNDWQASKVEAREKVAKQRIADAEAKDKAAKKAEDKVAAAEQEAKDVDTAIKDYEDSVNESVQNASKAVQDEMKDVSDNRIKEAAVSATNQIPSYVTSKFDPDFLKYKATMTAASDSLSSRGLRNEASAVKHMVDALDNALERKALYPDNPEWWLSAEDVKYLKDKMNSGVRGNSWYGDLYQRLRIAVHGDDDTRKLVSVKKINEEVAKQRYREGKLSEGGVDAPGIK